MGDKLFSNRQLYKLIIPLIIEQGLTNLVGMLDGIMVSSVGEAAISGVSLVDMINAVILVLFAALATGGSVVTSQFIGARDREKAQRSVGQLILMALGLGVIIMVPCLLFAEELLMLCFGAIEPDVKEQAEKILNTLGVPVSNAINMFYKQIILQRGLPFDVKMPQNKPVSIAALTEEQLNEELEKGYTDMLEGRVQSADMVFAEMSKEYGI